MSTLESEKFRPGGVPKEGEFADGKLWFHRRGAVVTIGLTSYGVDELGEVEKIEFPDEGEEFDKGQTIATVIGLTGKLEIVSPASGTISEINNLVIDQPEIITEDPHEEGWLIKIEVSDPSELKAFLLTEE